MGAKVIMNADRAWVRNYPPLWDWLARHKAQNAWQLALDGRDRSNPDFIEGWLIGAVLVIVIVRANRDGWDIFVPHHDTTVEGTIAAADAALARW